MERVMTDLFDATRHKPFSNGTECDAWMSVWCEFFNHDHSITHGDPAATGEGCQIMLHAVADSNDEWRWPEAWLPEPRGSFSLPSRLICGQFQPCEQGTCDGDPHADTRSAIVAETTDWWMQNARADRGGDVSS
jgi:hypothetical protein